MKKLVYVGDPMCSWCYGFAPTMTKIYDNYCDRLEISLVTGGLYTGGTTYQTEGRIAFLKDTWSRIAKLSGQAFDFSILEKKDWLYDTELSCRAVVAMRRFQPGKVFDHFHEIQANFYARGADSQDEETFRAAAEAIDVDGDGYMEVFRSEQCVQETREDFIWAKRMGVSGFPTILISEDDRWGALSSGFQGYEAIEKALERWLKSD